MKKMWILGWIILSVYHLIDFALFFTPLYGYNLSFGEVGGLMWCDIGKLIWFICTSALKCSFLSLSFEYFWIALRYLFLQKIANQRYRRGEEGALSECGRLQRRGVWGVMCHIFMYFWFVSYRYLIFLNLMRLKVFNKMFITYLIKNYSYFD